MKNILWVVTVQCKLKHGELKLSKMTYFGTTGETFIQSPMNNHYPSQKDGSQRLRMAHL
jgi:hypothetical protein